MGTIYTLNGQQVYNTTDAAGNQIVVNAQTGQPISTQGAPPGPAPLNTQSTSYGVTNAQPSQPVLPPLPSSVITQYKNAVASGQMSLSAADAAIQGMGGQYSLSNYNSGQITPPAGTQYTDASGATYTFGQGGAVTKTGASQYNESVGSNGQVNGSSTGASSAYPSTGNANMDAAQSALASAAQGLAAGGQIPAGLQITPAIIQQFMAWAHDNVDPQTQQMLQNEAAGINNAIQNYSTNYQNTQAETLQGFGTQLASQDNSMAGAGLAFGGLRNLSDENLANTTNRTLSTNAANENYNISNLLQQGGAALGTSNAGLLNEPTGQTTPTVSLAGGSRGSSDAGTGINFNYNPAAYTVGSIPTSQNTALNDLVGNYENQYSTLAANNSGKTFSDLYPLMTGLPAGASSSI